MDWGAVWLGRRGVAVGIASAEIVCELWVTGVSPGTAAFVESWLDARRRRKAVMEVIVADIVVSGLVSVYLVVIVDHSRKRGSIWVYILLND